MIEWIRMQKVQSQIWSQVGTLFPRKGWHNTASIVRIRILTSIQSGQTAEDRSTQSFNRRKDFAHAPTAKIPVFRAVDVLGSKF